jgi:hypothetical protein
VNGLTERELRRLTAIKALARVDLTAAKRDATAWMREDGARRRVIRRMALNTVRSINAWRKGIDR